MVGAVSVYKGSKIKISPWLLFLIFMNILINSGIYYFISNHFFKKWIAESLKRNLSLYPIVYFYQLNLFQLVVI